MLHGRRTAISLPEICGKGKVFYITTAFPPVPAGSSVINRNLLSKFNPDGFKVLTTKAKLPANIEQIQNTNVTRIFRSFYFSSRLNYYLSSLQIKGAVDKTLKQIEKEKPVLLTGVFPDYYFLKITRDAAKQAGVPFIAYLHDTISESHSNTRLSRKADLLQEQIFAEASAIFVMSRGMSELYKKKYGLDTIPLEHTYLETIPDEIPFSGKQKQAFWGGDIYSINLNSVKRVSEALRKVNCGFFLATGASLESLSDVGIGGTHIKKGFFSKRDEYLENLKRNELLILALDWADESPIHRDELATIFPTKTPEYLASGSPILVHCPEDYFLAKFFKEGNCGFVISERSPGKIAETAKDIIENPEKYSQMKKNALNAARLFDSDRISKLFSTVSDKAANLNWSEKLSIKEFV